MAAADASYASLFKQRGEETTLKYAQIPDLPPKIFEALAKHDVDKNGEISLSELLNLTKNNRRLTRTVAFLALATVLLLGSIFAVSYTADNLSKDTDTNGNAYIVKGSNDIVRVADATEEVPTALAPLLDDDTLNRVTQLAFHTLNPAGSRELLPYLYIMKLSGNYRSCSTNMAFYGINGEVATVNLGTIELTGIPGFPGQKFFTCSKARCSSISVAGYDIAILETRAASLGYPGYNQQAAPSANARRGWLSNKLDMVVQTIKKSAAPYGGNPEAPVQGLCDIAENFEQTAKDAINGIKDDISSVYNKGFDLFYGKMKDAIVVNSATQEEYKEDLAKEDLFIIQAINGCSQCKNGSNTVAAWEWPCPDYADASAEFPSPENPPSTTCQRAKNSISNVRHAEVVEEELFAIVSHRSNSSGGTECFMSVRGTMAFMADVEGSDFFGKLSELVLTNIVRDISLGESSSRVNAYFKGMQEECEGCIIHGGFFRGFTKLEPQITAALEDLQCKDKPLSIASHSLGAAISVFAADFAVTQGYQLKRLYTFGEPRTGNTDWSEHVGSKLSQAGTTYYRVVNANDPVPHLPMAWMFHGWQSMYPEIFYKTCDSSGCKSGPANYEKCKSWDIKEAANGVTTDVSSGCGSWTHGFLPLEVSDNLDASTLLRSQIVNPKDHCSYLGMNPCKCGCFAPMVAPGASKCPHTFSQTSTSAALTQC